MAATFLLIRQAFIWFFGLFVCDRERARESTCIVADLNLLLKKVDLVLLLNQLLLLFGNLRHNPRDCYTHRSTPMALDVSHCAQCEQAQDLNRVLEPRQCTCAAMRRLASRGARTVRPNSLVFFFMLSTENNCL